MAAAKVRRIIRILKKYYGKPKFTHFADPLDELIVTVLSQNTNWRNASGAFKNLKDRFKTWEEAYWAKTSRIKGAIKTGGLAGVKSKVIKGILKKIKKDHKNLSLKFLKKYSFPQAWEYLNSFKGIGPKTASCLMLFSLKMPALPVDTHILRVSKRIGLINKKTTLEQAHRILGRMVGEDLNDLYYFHVDMILHGRRVCSSRDPKCLLCPLKSECRYFSYARI